MAEELLPADAAPERELLTYREAAEHIDLSPDYIAHLVSRGILHPVKLEGVRQKYLHRDEVEWYGQRRDGSLDLNPYLARMQQEPSLPLPTADPDDSGQLTQQLQLADLDDVSLGTGAVLLLFLLLALATSFVKRHQFDEDKLRQFKTAPQLQSWRRVIKRLGEVLPEEPAA